MKRKLKVFLAGLLTFTALFSMFAADVQADTTITKDESGMNGGYYYYFWNQGGGSVAMTLGDGGNYGVSWNNCSNFICGKGWKNGAARVINYSGTFNGGSNGYLALYGWTKSPLVEYYVIENHGAWVPPGGTPLGTYSSDGGTYTIYKNYHLNEPTISGYTFVQYFSVRKEVRSSGTITFANHIKAWEEKGMKLGTTWDFQIMETEGYQSSGSSNITVCEEPTPTQNATPIPTISADNFLGDFNNDGVINMADILIIAKAFGSGIGDPRYDPLFDLNNDGYINMADIMLVAVNFNKIKGKGTVLTS